MYTIKNEEIIIIPVDFNIFYETAKKYKKNIKYSKECTISESFFEELFFMISEDSDCIFAIDMKNVVSYPTRLFSRLDKYLEKIVFYNIAVGNRIRDRLSEDLEELKWIDNIAYLSVRNSSDIIELVEKKCNIARQLKINEIIRSLVECKENTSILLASSGLYSNCYVDVKRLFFDVDNFYYSVFLLAEKIANSIGKIDAFVSSSKNGAIIANILGGLLDIKEVHLIGIGPKYSMELGDSIDCIKEGKKYAYIFDFMCTGTELKIVSALINSKKAYLLYAAGIAKYKEDINFSLMNKIDVLADTKDIGIDYRVVGEAHT